MGFYAGHGVEVVLFLQPPGTRRLEAVKLTGDENVPRGELTFVVPDLRNIVEVETGKEWGGARVIPASGQVADTQFRNGKRCPKWVGNDRGLMRVVARFIPCNLLWIDNDDVALHWMFPDDDDVGGGSGEFVNRYKRMDVDVLLYGDGPIGENDGSGMELTLA